MHLYGSYSTRIESGSDDPDYLGHLSHFLVGQAGLTYKLNYLYVIQIYNRWHILKKRYWCLISEWTLGLVNALNHHWHKLAYYLKVLWSMWSPEISFLTILHMDQFCILPIMKKFSYSIASYPMSFYIIFKENFNMWVTSESYVGHTWVTSWLLCGSVGQQLWLIWNSESYLHIWILNTTVSHFDPCC